MSPGRGTRATRAGLASPGRGGAPLVGSPSLAAVAAFAGLDDLDTAMESGRDAYRRYGNDSVVALERALAELETVEEGETPLCRVTASGQAALLLALTLLLTPSRRRVVVVRPTYGATEGLIAGPLHALGVEVATVDGLDALPEALGDDVACVVAEVITNPVMHLLDLDAFVSACHAAGAAAIVDATLATPFLVQPFAFGADCVVHSLSKSLSGHSDVLGGALLVAADSTAGDWLDAHSRLVGAVLGPFDAWLALRGLRTAGLRVAASSANAAALATRAAASPAVCAVHYPGTHGDAEEALALRLLPRGRGAMLGLDLGSRGAAEAFLRACPGMRLAPSLGDVATTVSHPALSSHRGWSAELRAAFGIGEGLLRFSVGCEETADLLAELDAGLEAAARMGG
jgi:cystathionine gamma-synthase